MTFPRVVHCYRGGSPQTAQILATKEHKEHKEKKLCLCALCVLLWLSPFGCGYAALSIPRFRSSSSVSFLASFLRSGGDWLLARTAPRAATQALSFMQIEAEDLADRLGKSFDQDQDRGKLRRIPELVRQFRAEHRYS